MKIFRVFNQTAAIIIILMLALPVQISAQQEGGPPRQSSFSREQLAQMLAPIALYPDSLLSQILMASTYPIELVEADRWLKKNSGLKDDDLDKALLEKEWDPSVKSLCHFPSVLNIMSEKIVQTTMLGDAFLAQPDDVMTAVQELRSKARDAGNLKSTKEQKVVVEKETIIIEPASPEVIYVPSYDPLYVYGPWWYPGYPPYYWWPAPVIVGTGLAFWPGIFVGAFIGSWCYFDWHSHVIHIDWGRTHRFHHHRGDRDGRDRWHHDRDHRRGVAYRDRDTARKYGQSPDRSRESRRDFRGFPERRPDDRGLDRSPQRRGDAVGPDRGRIRDRIDRRERPLMPRRESIFNGSRDAGRENMESERGRRSREYNGGSRREGAGTGSERIRSGGQGDSRSQGGRGQKSGQDGRGDRGRMGR